jgi:hypothetical protein
MNPPDSTTPHSAPANLEGCLEYNIWGQPPIDYSHLLCTSGWDENLTPRNTLSDPDHIKSIITSHPTAASSTGGSDRRTKPKLELEPSTFYYGCLCGHGHSLRSHRVNTKVRPSSQNHNKILTKISPNLANAAPSKAPVAPYKIGTAISTNWLPKLPALAVVYRL